MITAAAFLQDVFDSAGEMLSLPSEIDHDLDSVFGSSIKGFREVVFTVVVARAIDPSYQPVSDFYQCNPRPLYEGPIRAKLTDLGVPRGKSGPLNVAKATDGLTVEWATRRRQPGVAMAVVRLAEVIGEANPNQTRMIGVSCAARFLLLAEWTASLAVEVDPTEDLANLVNICNLLVIEEPDAGNTPQRITGMILAIAVGKDGEVEGYQDAASTTNTTSRKAGDMVVRRPGLPPTIVEVTVKHFDGQRMEDSYDAVRAMDVHEGTNTGEVVVLCRAEDTPGAAEKLIEYGNATAAYLGSAVHEDLVFEFIDIFEWMASQLATFSTGQRRLFHQTLNSYVDDPNTSAKVKNAWRSAYAFPNTL